MNSPAAPFDPSHAAVKILGIDASRNRSGGAKRHLVGILRDSDPGLFGVEKVHVWSYPALLDALPDRPWLVRHSPPQLQGPLWQQMWWQFRHLPREAAARGCQVLLNTDAGSICHFRPSVVMSRDMLSYEPGEMDRYRLFGKAWLRLAALRFVQTHSMRFADGVIFLTRYAASVIQRATGPLRQVAIIPHGVGDEFKQVRAARPWPQQGEPVKCVYVSNAAPYKHQWHVVRAFAELRQRGRDVELELVGGGSGAAQQRLEEELRRSDPRREFVTCIEYLPASELPGVLADAHLFVFASSCENMPNTLVEAMAAGLPIACSNRGPMPEVLADGGVTFDPEDPSSIREAVERLLDDPALRRSSAMRARALADEYSWSRCGHETWQFLLRTAQAAR
jgi:glycosyltransferase involved in cell wall biosynthesis